MKGSRERRPRGASRAPAAAEEEVLRHLRQRGLSLHRLSPLRKTLLEPLSDAGRERFYRLLRHYGFRLFLRDLIRDRRQIRVARLARYLTRSQAGRHVEALVNLGILRRHRARLDLATSGVDSFGDTLEWYVAEILGREFSIPAVWGVTLRGTEHGGNFDVLALPAGRLAYVEVKSSPPKHVEEEEVATFLDRVRDLGPDLALFLEDTSLRMKDKIVPLFESALAARAEWSAGGAALPSWAACAPPRPERDAGEASRPQPAAPVPPRPQRLRDEIFHVDSRIFIVNSDPDLARNLGHCLRAFFRSGWSDRLHSGASGPVRSGAHGPVRSGASGPVRSGTRDPARSGRPAG